MQIMYLLMSFITIAGIQADGNTSSEELKVAFSSAINDGNIVEIKQIISNGFDVNQELLWGVPLQESLVYAPNYLTAVQLTELLFKAGAYWPYKLADTLIIKNLEICRMETITQYLKSQWMLSSNRSPEWSFRCKQMIPLVDRLELEYKRKDKSDLLFFDCEDKDLSNVDICCKQLAYKELFAAIEWACVDALKATLALGVDLNYRDNRGVSVLFYTFSTIQFHSVDVAVIIVRMLLDAGARWTDKEFEKISDPEIAFIKLGTMTSWMLQNSHLYELMQQDNMNNVHLTQTFKAYSERCKEIALFLDEYELVHQLKERSEIV